MLEQHCSLHSGNAMAVNIYIQFIEVTNKNAYLTCDRNLVLASLLLNTPATLCLIPPALPTLYLQYIFGL